MSEASQTDQPVLSLSLDGSPVSVRYVDSRHVTKKLAEDNEGLADLTKDSDLVRPWSYIGDLCMILLQVMFS